ncbi:MAG: YdcF family protein [Streptococcus mitis]|uniref:YdcF family protein n=1 Tax=uncultured Streptococcus sp. TaxID=83427 RepID=UPI00280AA9E9|nr:YdcF family protein [uncultured Streptococcus sp.]MDU1406119.1 YdcF family protein [Streptococcus mitis]
MYLVIGIVLAFIVSFWKDNRSLWNPVLFLLSLISSYFYLGYLFYQNGYEKIHFAFFIFSFILLPILIFLGGIFLIYNGLILLKREGRSKANYLSMLLGIVILLFFALMSFRLGDRNELFYTNHFLNILFAFIAYSYFIFGFAFVGFMLYSILYLFIPKKKHYDFIIIHGAGLLDGEKVTPLLKRRIDKAVEAYHKSKNPRIKIIASGGQGGDEKISEAQAICNYLLEETDVPREAILLEEDSTTTYENLLFSKEMGERLVTSPRFLFVTNDYHVFRTSTYARRIGMKGDGLGCRTAAYYIPSAFIREYIALCVKMRWLFITLYVLVILALIFSYRGVLW